MNANHYLCQALSGAALFLGLISTVQAEPSCRVLGNHTTAFGPVIIKNDLPIGAELARYELPRSPMLDCTRTSRAILMLKVYGSRLPAPPIPDIRASGLPGIGYAVYAGQADFFYGVGSADKTGLRGGTSDYDDNKPQVKFQVILYKTGPITPGSVAGKIIASVFMDWDYLPQPSVESPLYINNFSVTAASCSLNSTSISVPLGDVLNSRFTGVGSTTSDKSFDLGLTCDKDARINVSLAGTQNSDTSETSVLALTNAGQQGSASGVGVQLLYGDTPLKLNNNLVLKTSAGGQETLAFTARYYQTKSAVGVGTANSSATLNITYQ